MRVVEPLLAALADGTTTVSSQYPDINSSVASLLDSKASGQKVRSNIEIDFWRRHGTDVNNEYSAWRAWLAGHVLDEPLPKSTYAKEEQVKFLFEDAFYGAGLNSTDIWCTIAGELLTRRGLCEMFLLELNHSVCCYCDIDTVRGQFYFDHFVPRAVAPYLSVEPDNLYVACSSCNSPQVGKGARTRFPIALPVRNTIGEKLHFSLSKNGLDVSSRSNSIADNFVSLLKLSTRYSDSVVRTAIISRAMRIYESLLRSGDNFSLSQLLNEHHKWYKDEPLLYASRAVLIDTYAADVK